MTIKEIPRGRALSPDERAAFLAAQHADYEARLRQMRDECDVYPELMVVYGFAWNHHPTTEGLMSYLHTRKGRQS